MTDMKLRDLCELLLLHCTEYNKVPICLAKYMAVVFKSDHPHLCRGADLTRDTA